MEALETLPEQINDLFEGIVALPHIDPTATTALPLPDPSKRLWETNKTGYVNWAVGQLVSKTREQAQASGAAPRSTIVENTLQMAQAIGEPKDMKGAANVVLGKVVEDDDSEVIVDDDDEMDTT